MKAWQLYIIIHKTATDWGEAEATSKTDLETTGKNKNHAVCNGADIPSTVT